MLRQLIVAVCVMFAAINFAFAGVDVNTADRAALEGVNDIGAKTADAIIAERKKGGAFKDWTDLVTRVKGIGPNNAAKMSEGGLTVNDQSKPNAPAKAAAKAKAKPGEATSAAKTAEPKAAEMSKDASAKASAKTATPESSAKAATPDTTESAKAAKSDASATADGMPAKRSAKRKQGAEAPASN
jgi:competence protein ComEA